MFQLYKVAAAIIYLILIVQIAILTQVIMSAEGMLLKRQTHDSLPDPNGSKNPPKSTNSKPAQDHVSLKAAELFFENDDLKLSDAVEQANQKYKFDKELVPFSSDVIRRGSRNTKPPKGYHSKKNLAALSAETYLKNGNKYGFEEAMNKGIEKTKMKSVRNTENVRMWRTLAANEPSKARYMKSNVPIHIPKKLYLKARSEQLHERGMASTKEDAMKLAQEELNKDRARKKDIASQIKILAFVCIYVYEQFRKSSILTKSLIDKPNCGIFSGLICKIASLIRHV
jgi:hypothetical protein